MHQVGGGKSFRHHVAGLHQLQAELQRVGVIQPAADGHRARHEKIALGQVLNVFFQAQSPVHPFGNAPQIVQLHVARERIREQVQREELASVGLGRRHAFLAAGMDQQRIFHQLRHHAARFVGDADRGGAALAGVGEHGVGVGRFAGLRNADHQHVPQVERAFIQRQDRRRGERNRNARRDLDEVSPELRGVVGGAARHHDDHPRPVLFEVMAQLENRAQPALQRLGQRLRLLPRLFEHFRHGVSPERCYRGKISSSSWRDARRPYSQIWNASAC